MSQNCFPEVEAGSRVSPAEKAHINLSIISSSIFGRKIAELQVPMGSILGDLPSFDPHNFSQHRPSDPSNPSRMVPTTYHPTHNRTLPPPDQVITTEVKNILIRSFYQRAEDKMRPKRPASEHLAGEHGNKHFRASSSAQGL